MKYTINVMLIAIVVLFSSFNSNKEKLSTAILESDLPITITSPAGGQDYCLNEQQSIEWQTTGGVVTTVSIFLMESNGQTIHRTIATDVPNSGQYLWNRDASAEGNFLIKITGKSEMSEDIITGQTGVFALKDCRKPDLRVGMMGAKAIGSGIIAEGQRILYIGEVVNSGETTVQNPTVKMMLDRPGNQPSSEITVELDATIVKNGKANFEKAFRVHKPGTYTVTLILDPGNSLDEMDEMNNERTRSFNVPPLPDLIVYISNNKRPPVGREREIRIVVKNIGSVATNSYGNWNLRSYVKQKGVKNYDIPPLVPGETHTIKRKHKWGTAGTKKVNARISTTHTELNADNNFVEGAFFVRLPHHDTYAAGPAIKCSTGETFTRWEDIEN